MQLGFVSAIFPDFTLEEVIAFAADEGFACVELMCWPPGEADRRYAGVTHVDVTRLDEERAGRIRDLVRKQNIAISGLGYYPNPLDPNGENRRVYLDHLKKVIAAAPRLEVSLVNTFVGRDPARSVQANWPLFQQVWPDLVRYAEQQGVNLAIENCPMLFSHDEWPGGKNLAVSPAVWEAMFQEIPSQHFGLNFDPSHLVWQHIDYVRCVRDFGPRIFHVHAKDTRIDPDRLYVSESWGSAGIRRSCPAWEMWIGDGCSRRSRTPATQARSASKSRTGHSKAPSPTASAPCGRVNAFWSSLCLRYDPFPFDRPMSKHQGPKNAKFPVSKD